MMTKRRSEMMINLDLGDLDLNVLSSEAQQEDQLLDSKKRLTTTIILPSMLRDQRC